MYITLVFLVSSKENRIYYKLTFDSCLLEIIFEKKKKSSIITITYPLTQNIFDVDITKTVPIVR